MNNFEKMHNGVGNVLPHRGRPRKFARPSRAVTLTLPEEVIATLESVDRDLSRAVVRVTQPRLAKRPHPPAELTHFGRRAVIVVNPTRTLEQHTGVLLVPLSDGRALLSFADTTPEHFELAVRDALDDRRLTEDDARVFRTIADILSEARRSQAVHLRQRSIIVLEAKRPGGQRTGGGTK